MRLVWVLLLAPIAMAQHKIEFANYTIHGNACELDVRFDANLAGPPDATLHDQRQNVIPHLSPAFAPGSQRTVRFTFSGACPSEVHDAVFASVSFMGVSAPQTQMTIQVSTLADLINLMSKVPQTQEEKSIFASGLATTASSGTAGALDVNLNSNNLLGSQSSKSLFKGFLQIKRSSTNGGDPKNFEAGMTYQSGFALGKAKGPIITAPTITALLVDFTAKSEGTASQFGVNNLVGDTSLSLQSSVFDLGVNSTFKFRFVGGVEGGSNQSKGNAPVQGAGFTPLKDVDWIARGKAGFETTLAYNRDQQHPWLPFERVDLTAAAVERYLWFNEIQFSQATSATDTVAHGNHPWAQVDLKLILGHNDSADYGVKLTYQRGSLPPVFADVKAFQFGFVYETKDRTGK